jgi:hypothetical protein
MPTVDADPTATAATDRRNHSVNTGANQEIRARASSRVYA